MKLSNLQIFVVAIGWFYSIYFAIWAFIIYSTSNPYNVDGYGLAGTLIGGIAKSLTFFLINGLIILVTTILILIENHKNQEEFKRSWQETDYIRVIFLLCLIFFSLPWILAVQGIFISDIPGLNLIFIGRQIGILGTNPLDYIYPAVHLGLHHGFDGFFYISFSIIFSILAFKMKDPIIRNFSIFGVGFLASYGLIAFLEDIIHEQIIKRGIISPIYPFLNFLYEFGIYLGLFFCSIIFNC